MVGVRVPHRLKAAQAIDAAQLRKNQSYQMIPAVKQLVVSIPIMPLHRRGKPPPPDRLEQRAKHAIVELHARSS